MPADLSPGMFQHAIIELMGAPPVSYDWIVDVDKPVALFLGNPIAAGRGVEVQADFFPWATPRQKMEATAAFLREVPRRFELQVFFFSDEANEPFFQRFCRYRMLRKAGRITNHFGGGVDGIIYHTAGPV